MRIFIVIFAVVVILLIYLQFKYVNRLNNTFEINETTNPDKDSFEKILEHRTPSVFYNIGEDFDELQKFPLTTINKIGKSTKEKLFSTLKQHYDYYLIPLCLKSNYDIILENKHTTTKLKKQTHFRLMIAQLKGSKTVILFPPNTSHNLYPDSKHNTSTIDIWDTELDKLDNLRDVNYLEVVLFPGNMLYIPYKWWYATLNNDDSYSIYQTSESLFSSFLKI